jgi:hypothetical protein
VPNGSILKCISELLLRCAPSAPVHVDAGGIVFVACDPASGRLVHVSLKPAIILCAHHIRGTWGGDRERV